MKGLSGCKDLSAFGNLVLDLSWLLCWCTPLHWHHRSDIQASFVTGFGFYRKLTSEFPPLAALHPTSPPAAVWGAFLRISTSGLLSALCTSQAGSVWGYLCLHSEPVLKNAGTKQLNAVHSSKAKTDLEYMLPLLLSVVLCSEWFLTDFQQGNGRPNCCHLLSLKYNLDFIYLVSLASSLMWLLPGKKKFRLLLSLHKIKSVCVLATFSSIYIPGTQRRYQLGNWHAESK